MKARIPTPRQSEPSKPTSGAQKEAPKHLPKPYKLRRFYLPSEVALHCTKDNCWVSFFDQVFDLTQLLQEHFTSPLCDPLTLAAGTDITHWFDPKTREVRLTTLYHVILYSPKHSSIQTAIHSKSTHPLVNICTCCPHYLIQLQMS